MAGILRQAEQYGLDVPEPRDLYASVPEHEVADLLRSGPRIHSGTLDRRDVSRETSEPDYSSLIWQ